MKKCEKRGKPRRRNLTGLFFCGFFSQNGRKRREIMDRCRDEAKIFTKERITDGKADMKKEEESMEKEN